MVDKIRERFITSNKSTIMVRVPGCKQKNFHKSKLQEAIKARDALCLLVGLDPASKYSFKGKRTHTHSHSDKKSNLPVGIFSCFKRKALVDGTEKLYESIVAIGHSGSKPKAKTYAVTKYGRHEDVAKAIEWRRKEFEALENT